MLKRLQASEITLHIQKIESAEPDEMWSYVGHKENQRRLWHAIDHTTGAVLAYAFGDRKDSIFQQLKER